MTNLAKKICIATLLAALACSVGYARDLDEFDIPQEEFEPFARALQAAIKEKNVQAVANLVKFPLKINLDKGKSRQIDKATFMKEYDQIFVPQVVKQVLSQNPTDLFQNYQGVMFGNGAVWASDFCPKNKKRPECPVLVMTVNMPYELKAK